MTELDRLAADLPVVRAAPRRRRRRSRAAVRSRCSWLSSRALIVLVPPELLLGIFVLLAALGMIMLFVLAPVWVPVLLASWPTACSARPRRSAGPRPAGWR